MPARIPTDPTVPAEFGTGDNLHTLLVSEPPTTTVAPSTVRAIGVSLLAQQVRELRGQHAALGPQIDQVGEQTYKSEWSLRTKNLLKGTVPDALATLAGRGFAWRDIAQMVGVSVPAVSKWRKGEAVTADNARKLFELVAMCTMLEEHFDVQDVAMWFEVPLSAEAPITPIDLWKAGRVDLIWLSAEDNVTGETVLDRFDIGWRERYRSDYEVFRAGDGALSIRPKSR